MEKIISSIRKTDESVLKEAQERTANLIMPFRAMGRLNELSEELCSIYGTLTPVVENCGVFVMAGDHGVVEEGVSLFPQVVTCEMIKAFLNGYATISVLSKQENCKIIVSNIGTKCTFDKIECSFGDYVSKNVVRGTKNFTKEPAMTRQEAIKSVKTGFEIADEYIKRYKLHLLATGEMGIGNTTPSAAIGSVITGNSAEEMTGKGTGISDKNLLKKIEVIKKGIALHQPDKNDPIDVLAKIGGAEIGAIAGSILAAGHNGIPAVVDGFISTAGALIATELSANIKDYIIASHCSEEPGHKKMLEFLSKKPLLTLGLRLGEGTGAVLAMPLIKQAANMIKNVATFAEAGVSEA